MTSKLTRERIELIANFHRAMTLPPSHDEIEELARMVLAAMESEPVIIVGDDGGDALSYRRLIQSFAPGTKLYRHAPPAPERDQVRREHAEWSQATFGNVGPIGPLKHLSKEALETAAEPADLSEWADMQFLLWDAQRRAGITDEQITQAMIEKLAVNKQREWPEPKDGEPRLHIKEQMAPVTQQEPIAWLNDAYLARGVVDGEAGSEDAGPGYIPVYREPATQPAPVVPPMQHWEELCRQYPDMSIRDAIIRAAWWNHCRAAMLQAGNSPAHSGLRPEQIGVSPAQSHGWIPVSERMPEMGEQQCYVLAADFKNHYWPNIPNIQVGVYGDWFDDGNPTWDDGDGEDLHLKEVTHWMVLPNPPQEAQGDFNALIPLVSRNERG